MMKRSFADILQDLDGDRARKLARKLPEWAAADTARRAAGLDPLELPSSLSLEQCSSSATALYKASVALMAASTPRSGQLPLKTSCSAGPHRCATLAVPPLMMPREAQFSRAVAAAVPPEAAFGTILDLTGGLGVDSWAFSQVAERVVYFERDAELAAAAERNFARLGATNIEVRCETVTPETDLPEADLIYADPARRDAAGRKVFLLEDCTPDILTLLPGLLRKAPVVLLKLSPMADLAMLAGRLGPALQEIHVVELDGEVKELLCLLRGDGDFSTSLEMTSSLETTSSHKMTSSHEMTSLLEVTSRLEMTSSLETTSSHKMTSSHEMTSSLETTSSHKMTSSHEMTSSLETTSSHGMTSKTADVGLVEVVAVSLQSHHCCHPERSRGISLRFNPLEERDAEVRYAAEIRPGDTLLEPCPALLKAGAFRLPCSRWGLLKLAPSTHLYLSPKFPGAEEASSAPGDRFFPSPGANKASGAPDFPFFKARPVREVLPFGAAAFKQLRKRYPRAEVTARNLPLATDALRKKLGVAPGGDVHIFGCRLADGSALLIVTDTPTGII